MKAKSQLLKKEKIQKIKKNNYQKRVYSIDKIISSLTPGNKPYIWKMKEIFHNKGQKQEVVFIRTGCMHTHTHMTGIPK